MSRRVFKAVLLTGVVYVSWQCCSIVIPPVTLTGQKTAIEKQIIGEQTEIEKDVWMVSSAKTTSKANLELENDEKKARENRDNSYTYRAFAILEVYGDSLARLKADRVVGENNKGYVSSLINVKKTKISKANRKKYNAALADDIEKGIHYRNLLNTVKQINNARTLLVRGYILNQKKVNKKFKAGVKELVLQQKQKYHDAALKGEHVQLNNGKWVQK